MANSRQADPTTSHQAAREAELSGRAASQRAICLAWVNCEQRSKSAARGGGEVQRSGGGFV